MGFESRMEEGLKWYRNGRFSAAVPQFELALREATDDGQRTQALEGLAQALDRGSVENVLRVLALGFFIVAVLVFFQAFQWFGYNHVPIFRGATTTNAEVSPAGILMAFGCALGPFTVSWLLVRLAAWRRQSMSLYARLALLQLQSKPPQL